MKSATSMPGSPISSTSHLQTIALALTSSGCLPFPWIFLSATRNNTAALDTASWGDKRSLRTFFRLSACSFSAMILDTNSPLPNILSSLLISIFDLRAERTPSIPPELLINPPPIRSSRLPISSPTLTNPSYARTAFRLNLPNLLNTPSTSCQSNLILLSNVRWPLQGKLLSSS